MLLQSQTVTFTAPSWVGPTIAIALVIMAVAVLLLGIGVAVAARKLAAEFDEREKKFNEMLRDVAKSVDGLGNVMQDASGIVAALRGEVGAFSRLGRKLRNKIRRGSDRLERRLVDLESLYDVVHDEVEDTALDVAAGLRRFRRGRSAGIVGRMTRALLPHR